MLGFGGGDPEKHSLISQFQMINICLVENDILLDHPVTLPEAVLGAKVKVSTINGAVKMPIPLTTNTGIILL